MLSKAEVQPQEEVETIQANRTNSKVAAVAVTVERRQKLEPQQQKKEPQQKRKEKQRQRQEE
jgi:hypothetical protein